MKLMATIISIFIFSLCGGQVVPNSQKLYLVNRSNQNEIINLDLTNSIGIKTSDCEYNGMHYEINSFTDSTISYINGRGEMTRNIYIYKITNISIANRMANYQNEHIVWFSLFSAIGFIGSSIYWVFDGSEEIGEISIKSGLVFIVTGSYVALTNLREEYDLVNTWKLEVR